MYGGYGSQNQTPGASANQSSAAAAYNYDNLFAQAAAATESNAYNAQQYQQYLNALSQYNQQQASSAAGYGNILTGDYGATSFSSATNTAGAAGEPTAQQFSSFEQVIMQQARVQQQQQQTFPKVSHGFMSTQKPQSSPGRQPYFGKQPTQGGYQRRKGPPKPPVDPSKYFCETCNIACGGPQAYEDHMQGKPHKRKEELAKGNAQASKSSFICEICNVSCTGKEAFDTHLSGIKHSRTITNLKLLGKPIPEHLAAIPSAEAPKKDTTNGAGDGDEVECEPIGEEFIDSIPGGKTTQYKCRLCDCSCGDVTAKNLHVRGRRHRLEYKRKVDSSIHVDAKPTGRKARMQKPPKIIKFPDNWAPHPDSVLIPAFPDTTQQDSYDEQHIRAYLDQLRPEPKLIEETDTLIALIEKTLKKTSDLLTEKLNGGSQESADSTDDRRVLRGVVRVGILGNRLLLKSDRQITAVLMCKDIPTVALLQSIIQMFPENIEDEDLKDKAAVEAHVEDSAFLVKFKDGEMSALIKLTSIALAESDDSSEANGTDKIEKPKDALPIEPMRVALADLRQTKFFQSQCWPVHGLCECIVLLRDLFNRIPVWNTISLHALGLLMLKTVVTSHVPLRVSDSFRRFMEVIASGQFMSPRSPLIDPCEKGTVDILAHLNKQQRENIMVSAQCIIRLVAYDQIHTVLGMERLPSLTRKRPNNDEEDAEGDVKKGKNDAPMETEDADGAAVTQT